VLVVTTFYVAGKGEETIGCSETNWKFYLHIGRGGEGKLQVRENYWELKATNFVKKISADPV